MTFEEAEKFKWNPFDLTKVISFFFNNPKDHCIIFLKLLPGLAAGRFSINSNWPYPKCKSMLDRNPKDYFAEVHQIAFSPAYN